MKRTLLLCVTLAATVCTVSAQTARNRGLVRMNGSQPRQVIPAVKATPGNLLTKVMDLKKENYLSRASDASRYVQDPKEMNMMAWGLGMSVFDLSSAFEDSGNPNTLDFATYYSSELTERFNGNTIVEIPFYIPYGAREITFWIRYDLSSEDPDWEYVATLEDSDFPSGPTGSNDNDITHYLSYHIFELLEGERFEVNGTPFFAGVTIKYSNTVSTRFLVMGSSSISYYNAIGGDGENFFRLSPYYAIDLPLVTEGDAGLADNDIDIEYFDYVRAEAGSETPLNVTLVNFGSQPAASMKFNYTLNGQVLEGDIQVKNSAGEDFFVPYLCTAQLPFTASVPAEAGRYYSTITTASVNGEPDGFPQSTPVYGGIVSINDPFNRVPVMEQMTGTWCGYCPRGHLAVEQLDEEYGDRYIPIVIHFDQSTTTTDPFTAATYNELVTMAGGAAPQALINRSVLGDPFYGTTDGTPMGITSDLENIEASAGEASVGLSSVVSSDQKTIEVGTHILFHLPAAANSYSVAYALLEDNLTGSQSNYYAYYYQAGMTKAEIEAQFPGTSSLCDLGNPYTATYNHVARAIYDCMGIEGSLPELAVDGETMYHHYTIDVPSTVTNLDNCSIVSLLIDNFSGEIVTAAKAKIGKSSTGIAAAPADDFNAEIAAADGAIRVNAAGGTASVYTPDGKLVGQADVNGQASIPAERGAYIVRVVNGRSVVVKKVVL